MPAALSAKGQVTVPKKIREILKIHPGDFIDFIHERGEVLLKVAKREQAGKLMGSLREFAVPDHAGIEVRETTKELVADDTAKEDLSA